MNPLHKDNIVIFRKLATKLFYHHIIHFFSFESQIYEILADFIMDDWSSSCYFSLNSSVTWQDRVMSL